MIRKYTIPVTTTGSAGSATGTASKQTSRPGVIRFVAVDYHASAPATTDLVIKADDTNGATLFTVTNSATDITAKPVAMPGVDEGNAATAATDLGAGGFPYSTGIFVSLAQSDALAPAATVSVWVEQ